ncbi:hypothetical protein LCGC14_0355320 [marine sediment metagenome]|uniref:Uncharacterized protein n=1 Tax=marine sediment metagenome TaxID=412755 RepID=A0A0F9TSN7_9ZZZZ
MAEENKGTPIPGEEDPEKAPDGSSEGEEAQEGGETPDAELEARAKRMGWHGKEDYNGPEDRFVDAKTFIEKSETELPITRERLRRLDKRVAKQDKVIKEFGEFHAGVEARAYEKALTDIRREKRDAANAEDMEKYDDLAKQEVELEKTAPKGGPMAGESPPPEITDWANSTPWFKTPDRPGGNTGMTNFAIAHHGELLVEKPGLTIEENLEEVTSEVKRRFPEKFANPKRGDAASVEGTSGTKPPAKGGRSYGDLPADAKAACDSFIAEKLMTKAEYLKQYKWE